MKAKHLLYSVFITICILSLVTPASAGDDTTNLGEIVVTATRVEEPKKDVPASVQIITQEDIKDSTARNAGDLIAEAALGNVQKYPGALTSSIGLRGYSTSDILTSRVLILINGNNAGTVNLAKIPVDDIERVEIVKGPASVLYGSSAMGGVINIITKNGREEGVHGFVGGEAGSWNYWKPQVELSGKKGVFDYYLTADRSSENDYKAKDYGKFDNTGYDDETLSLRLGYRFLDKGHISVGFQHWKGWDIGTPGPVYSPDPDDYKDSSRNGFDLGYKTETFNAKYYLVKDRDEWHSGLGTGNSDISLKKTGTQGVSFQKTFPLGNHRIIAGGQWDRIKIDSSINTGAPYNPNARYDSYGLFTEDRLSLLEKKLLLSAGIRYDYFRNEILSTPGLTVNPRKEDLSHLTVRGGVVYKLTGSFSLKGNIGTAFRAPAPDELATDYVSSWGTTYIGNPDLKPEKSTSYDAGVNYSRELLKADVTFFHSRFRDKILGYYDPGLSAMTWKNVDGAVLQGIEVNLSYDAGLASGLEISVEPFANISYNTRYSSKDEQEISNYGKTLLYTPKWTGAFGIRAGQDRWDVRLIANYTGDEKVQDWDFSSPTYTDVVDKGDFTVVNFKGSFRPVKDMEITASAENLFNRAYEYVLGYPMPERTYTAGLKWIF